MKKFTLFLLFAFVNFAAWAEKVSQAEALKAAMPYMNNVQAAASQRQARAGSVDQPVYIFSRGAGEGFVIVSGDNSLPLVLGVADSGDWVEEEMPPLLLQWVKMYEHYVDSVQANGGAPARAARASVYPKSISPLLTSHWHQSAPYNNRCPQRADGGGRAVTGCVATAAAQIAYYWRNEGVNAETRSNTKYGYWSPDAPVTKDCVIPKGTKYMWELMRDNGGSTSAERDAVAVLCAVMGFDAELAYGASTGGFIWNEIDVFRNQIGLNGGTHVWKSDVGQTAFETLCANDLAMKHPILYAGYNEDSSAGHAIVMDGYRTSDNSFHFNFGWGGQGDGYYQLIDGSVGGYGYGESVVYNIYSPNINRTFEVTPEEELFQAVPNNVNVKVTNGSSMELNGVYLFAHTKASLPDYITLDDAIASYPGVLKAGDSWEADAVYETPNSYLAGVYFIVTDENLSILYTTPSAYKVKSSSANMKLMHMNVDSEVFDEREFMYEGELVTRPVYHVESNTSVTVSAELNNAGKQRVSSVKCRPLVTSIIYKVESDGSVTKVKDMMSGDEVFLKDETKTIDFGFGGLQRNVLYKASLNPKVGNGVSTSTFNLQYDTEASDTVVFFTLASSAMDIEREGNHVRISGEGYTSRDYAQVMADVTVTSYDLRNYTDVLPAYAPMPTNPNAIIYRNAEAGVTGRNIVVDGVCEELELVSGYSYDPVESFTAKKVEVKTGVVCPSNSYYWNSIVLPFTTDTPAGILARRLVDATAKTESHSDKLLAGTPYVYLTTHDRGITATNVEVKSLADMPASTGDASFVAQFVCMQATGAEYVSTGKEFAKADVGEKIGGLSAYKTNAISLTNMSTVARLDARMHALVTSIMAARDTLEKYTNDEIPVQHRTSSKEEAVAAYKAAIADAEMGLTLLPETYDEVGELLNNMTAATKAFVENEDVTAISFIKAEGGKQTESEDGVIYDLNGRRLNAVPQKGMYIIGGKVYVK